jgi:uncharacterized protein YjbJ (UPF0337 family)
MFINEHVLKGSWKQVKGEMQRLWGDITDDEWDRAQGNATALSGLVQKKYGLTQDEVETKFNDIFSRFSKPEDKKDSYQH